ncbi:probable inactive dual specificity protein phosphatase-like At4g18593 [Daucus carota subsp. sativus]|uniref:probable inactive dual specificity protein phosphatase-like At4g18593 n=1 Tax=Daucus carota subsp. sativus TaxID=79200 RepID=UPI00308340CF
MNEEPAECSSIYVEPMKWMEAVQEGFVGQKLQCIGCKGRLGSFNWAGMRCNCGAWVIPAFQLHKNRMDECSLSILAQFFHSEERSFSITGNSPRQVVSEEILKLETMTSG